MSGFARVSKISKKDMDSIMASLEVGLGRGGSEDEIKSSDLVDSKLKLYSN